MEKIAVFTDRNGKMGNFYDCVCFQIFVKNESGFIQEKTVEYEQIFPVKAAEVREDVKKLTELLEDCRIIAFGEISGIPFAVFDRAGFQIFSVTDYSEETLAGILNDIEQMQKEEREKKQTAENISPVESDTPGVYYMDLLKVQEAHPELSSKKILMEFLQNTPFLELNLKCAHIPPWIERDEKWKVRAEQTDGGIYAQITIRQC